MSDRDQSFSPSSLPSVSWSSTLSAADAIASYRRSQYIFAGQNVSSVPETSFIYDEERDTQYQELEGAILSTSNEHLSLEDDTSTPLAQPDGHDDMFSTLQWDDLDTPSGPSASVIMPHPSIRLFHEQTGSTTSRPRHLHTSEQTPLLRESRLQSKSSVTSLGYLSITASERPERSKLFGVSNRRMSSDQAGASQSSHDARIGSPCDIDASDATEKYVSVGKSTFEQTLFNSIAILLGFGMLSEPLAFSYAGWIGGILLVSFYGMITCYTAKILAHEMLGDPRIRTYADIGHKAFGPQSTILTSSLFCLELFAVSVVLVTLYGDSMHSIIPLYSANSFKLFGLIILIPTVFLPLSFLSYTSILGIMSSLLVIFVILIDGFSKHNTPGSLWIPAETRLGVSSPAQLGVAFGLFMAGFSGHAVLPSLARDMADPREFDRMINWAFATVTFIYALIGGCGYLMFGDAVSDEVSRDLLDTPGYNSFFNKLAVWSLVIMPLTKFALTTRPVNITLEIMLGIETSLPLSSTADVNGILNPTTQLTRSTRIFKRILMVIERMIFTILAVVVSIFVPEFSTVMAFLGSFSAFVLCVIGPVTAKIMLAGKCSRGDAAMLVIVIVMAAWGTIAAFAM